jgi:hypothetical protein
MVRLIQLLIIAAHLLGLIPEQNDNFLFWALASMTAFSISVSTVCLAQIRAAYKHMDLLQKIAFSEERERLTGLAYKSIFVSVLSIITLVFWH